ncbi:MAG: hypothetical protein UFG06_05245 [Lachnospiraceae bacterium]|nr:hypothetical protein [Lachnospiraceae bacterium]
MAHYDGAIRINTKLNTQGFNTGIQSMTASLGKLAAAVGIAFSVGALVKMGKQAIDLASDIQEVDNVVSKSFGHMRGEMDALANTAIEKLGMSRLTAYQTGSTFMAMGKSMLDSAEDAKDMALALTEATGNLSSFYNVTQDVASTALKSIYTGETETLKQFGIVMTETNLQQFAQEQGIRKTISAMSQSEKVTLRYKYVMEQLAFVGSDFADTQDSWANQTRILSEQWKELLSILGSGLITVLTPVVKGLNNIVASLINVANAAGKILSDLFGIQAQQLSVNAGSAEDAADAMTDYGNATEAAAKKAKNATAAFDDLNVLQSQQTSGGNGGGFGGEITSSDMEVTQGITGQISDKMSVLLATLSPLTEAVRTLWNDGLSLLLNFNADTWTDFYDNFLKPVGLWSVGTGLPRLAEIANDFLKKIDWSKLRTSLDSFYTVLGELTKLTFDAMLDFWEYFLSPLAAWVINDAFVALVNICTDFAKKINWNQFNVSLEKFYKVLEKFSTAIGTGLISFLTATYDLLSPVVIDLINLLAEGLEMLFDVLNMIPSGALEALGGALGGLLMTFITYKGAIAIMGGLETAWIALYVALDDGLKAITTAIASNPFLALATGIAALVGALISLEDAHNEKMEVMWDTEEIERYGDTVENITQKVSDLSEKMIEASNARIDSVNNAKDIEAQYLQTLADKYFNLSEKTDLSTQEYGELKLAAEQLVEAFPELEKFYNSSTGLIDANRVSVEKLIEAKKNELILNAISEEWSDALHAQIQQQKELDEVTQNLTSAQKEQLEIKEKLDNWDDNSGESYTEYRDKYEELTDRIKDFTQAQTDAKDALSAMEGEISYYSDLYSQYSAVGANYAAGMADGISAGEGKVLFAAENMGNNSVDSLKNVLRTHSPSKVTEEIGRYYTAGFNRGVLESINQTNAAIKAWISNAIDPYFALDRWRQLGENVRAGFSLGISGLATDVIDILNLVIGSFEIMARQINQAINGLIIGYNAVAQGTGSPLVGTVADIQLERIPKLATGAVIPPNQQFLAILGDQRGGTNIEAPLSTIENAVQNVFDRNSVGGNQEIVIRFEGTPAQMVRELRPYIVKENHRIGLDFRK